MVIKPAMASVADDTVWLAAMLERIGDGEVLRPRPRQGPPPVIRRWEPCAEGATMDPRCAILRRHPDLSFVHAMADLPVRKITRHRPPFGHGMKKEFTSSVTGRDVFAHSSLELDALRAMELDGAVSAYIEQPFLLRYVRDGETRIALPDALALRNGMLVCVEAKFEAQAAANEGKWAAIGVALTGLGIAYEVVTERHLRCAPFQKNVKEVMMRRHRRPLRPLAVMALDAVRLAGSATFAELEGRFGLSFREACFLIRHGLLACDLKAAPIGPASTVRWRGHCHGDPWGVRK